MRLPLPNLAQLKPRERLLAVASGVVLVVVVLDRLVLNPWLRHGRAIRQEITRMEAGLQRYNQLLARKDRVFAMLAQYQPYLKPVEADDLQMASLLKEVEEIARGAHLLLGEIKPIAPEVVAGAKQFSLDVRFECTMEEWVDFIHQIESSPSLFQVARAGLSVQDETPDRLEGYLRVVTAAMHEEEPREPPAGEKRHEPAT